MRSRHSVRSKQPAHPMKPLDEAVVPDHAEVLGSIRRYIVDAFRDGRGEGIGPDTPLVTSGIVDSAGVLQVIDWLEQTFGITIEDDAVSAENFDTLDALARTVVERLPA